MLIEVCQEKRGQQPLLDWLRFLASLLVVISHSKGFIFERSAGEDGLVSWFYIHVYAGLGTEAVLIFFVLSGFFVFGGILDRGQNFQPRRYVADRLSRLAPPMLLAVIFTFFVTSSLDQSINWRNVAMNTLFLQGVIDKSPLQNNPSFWTLSYEFWFYFIGLGVGLLSLRDSKRVVSSLAVLAIGLIIFTELRASYLFCWLLGGWAFKLRPKKIGLLILMAGTAAMFLEWMARHHAAFPQGIGRLLLLADGQRDALKILFSLGACGVIWALLRSPVANGNEGFSARWGRRLASISYSLYLIHYPALLLLNRFLQIDPGEMTIERVALHFITILYTLIIAWLAWLMAEAHTPRIRKWLRGITG